MSKHLGPMSLAGMRTVCFERYFLWVKFLENCAGWQKPTSKPVTILLHFLKMMEIRFLPERCSIRDSPASANHR